MTDTCEICGACYASPQICPGDGAAHYHGMVHTLPGGLIAVCDDCLPTVAEVWADAKKFMAQTRPANDPSDPRGTR